MLRHNELKQYLEENGQSQTWLASKLEIAPESLSRYLNNKEKAPKKIVLAIAQVLKIEDLSTIWEEPMQKKAS